MVRLFTLSGSFIAYSFDCRKDFGLFWLLVTERPDECTSAINTLLKQLTEAIGGSSKNTATVDSIVNAISFLTLHGKFKLDDKDIQVSVYRLDSVFSACLRARYVFFFAVLRSSVESGARRRSTRARMRWSAG